MGGLLAAQGELDLLDPPLPSRMVHTFIQMQQSGRSQAQIRSVRHLSIFQLSLAFLKELPPTRLPHCSTARSAELTT